MKRNMFITLVLLTVCTQLVRAEAATQQAESDVKSFELTAVAPPSPALKYRFSYPSGERIHGNAAPLYLDAVLLLMPGAAEKAGDALTAYESKDFQAFDRLANELDMPGMFDQLDQAGRRTECDFNPTLREKGVMALLPHLNFFAHGLEKSLRIRTLWQIKEGKVEEALINLRRGYVLAENINEPVLVSSLVSALARRWMNDTLAELMSRPESPNLYWAIRQLPPA